MTDRRIAYLFLLSLLAAPAAGAQDAPGPASRPALSEALTDMEHRMGDLEERMNVTRARLELILPDVSASGAARVRITHTNEMSEAFRLVRVAYAIDGGRIFLRSDPAGAGLDRETEIYDGAIPAGDHVLSVELEYAGRGYDVFSYFESYRFRVTSSHTFHAAPGERTDVHVIGYERGTPFVDVDESPTVRYVEESRPLAD